MVTRSSSWASKSGWLLAKDLKSEFRTRYALNAILLFALTTLTGGKLLGGGILFESPVNLLPLLVSDLLFIDVWFITSFRQGRGEQDSQRLEVSGIAPHRIIREALVQLSTSFNSGDSDCTSVYNLDEPISFESFSFLDGSSMGKLGTGLCHHHHSCNHIQSSCQRSAFCSAIVSRAPPFVGDCHRWNQTIPGRGSFLYRLKRSEIAYIICSGDVYCINSFV